MEVYVMCWEMVAQMQNPYKIFPFNFLLLPWSNATHFSVAVCGVGVGREIVLEFITTK
jgi:hypothetical protein